MSIEEFLLNYGSLHDSVIYKVEVLYPNGTDQKTIDLVVHLGCINIITFLSRDLIKLHFEKTYAVKFFEENFTNQVIFEARYKVLENKIAFDFSSESYEWNTIEEMKESSFYVLAESLTVEKME